MKGLLPMMKVIFGMLETLSQLNTNFPAGLGMLLQSCLIFFFFKANISRQLINLTQKFGAHNKSKALKVTHLINMVEHVFFGVLSF